MPMLCAAPLPLLLQEESQGAPSVAPTMTQEQRSERSSRMRVWKAQKGRRPPCRRRRLPAAIATTNPHRHRCHMFSGLRGASPQGAALGLAVSSRRGLPFERAANGVSRGVTVEIVAAWACHRCKSMPALAQYHSDFPLLPPGVCTAPASYILVTQLFE